MIRTGYGYSGTTEPNDLFPVYSREHPDEWDRPVVVIDRASAYAALRAAVDGPRLADYAAARWIDRGNPEFATEALSRARMARRSIRAAMRAVGAYVREDAL